jgi:hypothetical protein
MRSPLLLLLVLATALPAAAAPAPLASVRAVETVELAPLDRGWLAAEDAALDGMDVAPRFAIPHAVRITPADHGVWEDVAAGADGKEQALWRLRIRAEGATSLNLGFRRFHLPAGAELRLRSADGVYAVRPFTAADNAAHGELWTPVVPTDDLVVELAVPRAERGEVELELGMIGQGYRGFGASGVAAPKSKSCNMDVACLAAADPWWQTQRAVAVISVGGDRFCSGSLVNDTARDRKMYFVTAAHCGVDGGNAASLVVYWNYRNSTCRTPGSAASGGTGDGTLTQFQTGATFRAANAASDFTLVELDDPPNPAFNLRWAGWDRSGGDTSCPQGSCYQCAPEALCAGIHHPHTDEKRITFSRQTIQPASWDDGPTTPGDSTHLWVHWDPTPVFPPDPSLPIPAQATERGSSGSPLYDRDERFIGQLHGGSSACGQTGDGLSDLYGRFSVSWAAAAPFLDAANTGELAIDGRDFTDLLFGDGFESGDLAAWSATSP